MQTTALSEADISYPPMTFKEKHLFFNPIKINNTN